MTGKECLELAKTKIGGRYILGVVTDKTNPDAKSFDCAEFISWVIYQLSTKLYGCSDNSANPKTADAWTNFFKRDVEKLGKRIDVEKAKGTVGAILLRYTVGSKIGHIVFSDGKGGTVEAKSTKTGVVADTSEGRRWDTGILIPWGTYETGVILPTQNFTVYRLKSPMMKHTKIGELQTALTAKGYDTGGVDDWYGKDTMNAVIEWQTAKGLVVDGEAGENTFKSLGLTIA
jgi:N-acetylmuramoyl-L-alanine amidase